MSEHRPGPIHGTPRTAGSYERVEVQREGEVGETAMSDEAVIAKRSARALVTAKTEVLAELDPCTERERGQHPGPPSVEHIRPRQLVRG